MTSRNLMWVRRGLVGVAAGVVLGYASALISVGQCEVAAAGRVADELGDRDVFVLPVESASIEYPGSEAILRRSGFNVRACNSSPQEFSCFPWAGVANGKVVYPFLVDVRWGFVAAPLDGWGTRTRYVTLFGLVIRVRDFGGWVT